MSTPRSAVVVGVEDGADSRRAVLWAAAEAERRRAPLHLVHAMGPGVRDIPRSDSEYRWERQYSERVIADARAILPERYPQPVSSAVSDLPAAQALVVASTDAALTVVGAHGHSAGFDLLIGSVSLHLAHHAVSPVAVVRAQADPAARRIVVGVDGSSDSEAALEFAFAAAAHERVPLAVRHGWVERSPVAGGLGGPAEGNVGVLSAAMAPWTPRVPRGLGARIDEHEAVLRAAVAEWTAKYPEVDVDCEVVAVHPSRLLVDASEHAHLLVVGACGRGFFGGMRLGSVGQAALHHARCPVVIAR